MTDAKGTGRASGAGKTNGADRGASSASKAEAIAELRRIVEDGARPMAEREKAAHHLVRLVDAGVDTDVPDDDPELVRLTSPWKTETETDRVTAAIFSEWSAGMPFAEARRAVLAGRRTLLRWGTVGDSALSLLERLAMAQLMLDDLPRDDSFLRNGPTAEKLVQAAISAKRNTP